MTEFDHGGSDLIDYRKVKEGSDFLLRSVRRHKWLVIAVFVFVVVGVGVGLAVMPKTYHVETRLLVRLDPLLPSLAEPGRVLSDADASPLRTAVDMITARANLVGLIERTHLLEEWPRNRAPVLRLKDVLVRKIFGQPSDKDRLEALVELLRKKLSVWYEIGVQPNQGTVNISINWPDGHMAFLLVEAAQQGYIEARRVAAMSAIAEVNSILESHASAWRAEAQEAADELRKSRGSRSGRASLAQPASPDQASRAKDLQDPEAQRLSALLAAKQQVIRELDDVRLQTLIEAQKRLGEQKALYTDRHPDVIATRDRIATLSQESPQVAALRAEAKDLEARLMTLRSGRRDLPVLAATPRTDLPRRDEGEEPEVESARSRLKFALEKYQTLRGRADSAALEREARRAAFKYQYTVVVPAEPPKAPSRPNVPAVGAAGLVAGLLLGVFAAVFADIRGGRIVEIWQVERVLGLPVLAELTER